MAATAARSCGGRRGAVCGEPLGVRTVSIDLGVARAGIGAHGARTFMAGGAQRRILGGEAGVLPAELGRMRQDQSVALDTAP